jgi:hypothetical protein
MRLELHETEPLLPDPADHPLSGVRVALEAESRHPDTSAGLAFTVVLVNSGATPVSMQQPDDAIQVSVVDDRGSPVPVVTPPPAALINTRRRPGPYPNAPRIVVIEPGAEHRAVLAIHEVRADGRTVPLAPGRYRVRLKVLLLAAGRDLAREHSYRLFESDEFVVHHGA